jgi:hypothetical protein
MPRAKAHRDDATGLGRNHAGQVGDLLARPIGEGTKEGDAEIVPPCGGELEIDHGVDSVVREPRADEDRDPEGDPGRGQNGAQRPPRELAQNHLSRGADETPEAQSLEP